MAIEFSYPFDAIFDPETGMPVLNGQGEPDRLYNAVEDAMNRAVFFSDGIFANPSSNLKVDAAGAMTVYVRMGTATIQGYAYKLYDGDLVVAIPAANASYQRKDIIVVALDMLDRDVKVVLRAGTAGSNPQPPALIRTADHYELKLAEITVNANTTTIIQSNIADTRYNATVCGITAFNGSPIDVTNIYNQFQSYLNTQITAWDGIRNTQEQAWANQTALQQLNWEDFWAIVHLDIQNYAVFNFDNLAAVPGVTRNTTFSGSTITESITLTAAGTQVAKRVTTLGSTITTVETLYLPDGVSVSRTSTVTTTFPSGGVKEVVT